jgi:hypothetical protein
MEASSSETRAAKVPLALANEKRIGRRLPPGSSSVCLLKQARLPEANRMCNEKGLASILRDTSLHINLML